MMKWKDVKIGTLIMVKNQTATHTIGSGYYDQESYDYKYILILSDAQFQDDKKSRKRYFYFKAAFYDDMKEEVFTHRLRKEDMRSFMKIIDDEKIAKKIKEACFFEGL